MVKSRDGGDDEVESGGAYISGIRLVNTTAACGQHPGSIAGVSHVERAYLASPAVLVDKALEDDAQLGVVEVLKSDLNTRQRGGCVSTPHSALGEQHTCAMGTGLPFFFIPRMTIPPPLPPVGSDS